MASNGFICCLCKEHSIGWGSKGQYGNNPSPLQDKGECCNNCNLSKVIPARLKQAGVMKFIELEMSYDLKCSVEAEIKEYGKNTSFVTKIEKMIARKYESWYEAEQYANELGLGRTILMGHMGLIRKKQ